MANLSDIANPKHLSSDTVKTTWLTTVCGIVGAGAQVAAIWGLITPDIKDNILLTLPYAMVVLGPLGTYFRINIKTTLGD